MEFEELTDEEILKAIKASREVAKEGKLDYFETLREALVHLSDEKKAKYDFGPMSLEGADISGITFKTTDEILADAKETELNHLDSNQMSIILDSCEEEFNRNTQYIQRCLDRYNLLVAKSIQGGMRPESIPDQRKEFRELFENIQKGIYTPEKLIEVFENSSILFDVKMNQALREVGTSSENFYAAFILVNNIRREEYYHYCNLCSDFEMARKQHFITDMLNKALRTLRSLPKRPEPGTDITYAGFQHELSKVRENPDVGFEKDSVSTIPWPKSYESEASFLSDFVRDLETDIKYNHKMPTSSGTIDEIRKYIEARFNLYSNMSVDEFRNESIAKMKLTNEEKETYNSHMSALIEAVKEKQGGFGR